MTSTARTGCKRGLKGMFWRSSPPSTRERLLELAVGLVDGLKPLNGLGVHSAISLLSSLEREIFSQTELLQYLGILVILTLHSIPELLVRCR